MEKDLKNILLDKKISKKITKKDIILRESLINNLTSNYQIEGPLRMYPVVFFKEYKNKIINFLKDNIPTKVRFILNCKMKKKFIDQKEESFIYNDAYFNSNTFINIKGSKQKKKIIKIWLKKF